MNRSNRLLLSALSTGLFTLLALPPVPVQAQAVQEQPICNRRTDICEFAMPTGSNLRRAAAHGMGIDLDRRYAELSPEDKARLHDDYTSLPPGDEPPYPLDGLRPVYQSILSQQEGRRARSEIAVVVEVDSTGVPRSAKAFSSPDPELVRLVASVLMETRYKPARCSGKPCAMGFLFRYGVQTNLREVPRR
jgi:hypothetical protein